MLGGDYCFGRRWWPIGGTISEGKMVKGLEVSERDDGPEGEEEERHGAYHAKTTTTEVLGHAPDGMDPGKINVLFNGVTIVFL